MSEDTFWNLIELSLKGSSDLTEQENLLVAELKKLSTDDLIGFKLTLDKLSVTIHTSEMWCAAYLINGGCSDDGFDYFKNWVISKGKDIYYKAKANPDILVDYIGDDDEYEFETLDYVAVNVFEDKTGESLYDFLPDNTYINPTITFNWQEDSPDSMKAVCPKIFKKVDW